mmetsp:Transcript_25843/g.74457  ORF Transcript_25843/g.74457 Transcript_25843/m.74457 type:complete len:208 (-) Transcript_25843:89-712(-)
MATESRARQAEAEAETLRRLTTPRRPASRPTPQRQRPPHASLRRLRRRLHSLSRRGQPPGLRGPERHSRRMELPGSDARRRPPSRPLAPGPVMAAGWRLPGHMPRRRTATGGMCRSPLAATAVPCAWEGKAARAQATTLPARTRPASAPGAAATEPTTSLHPPAVSPRRSVGAASAKTQCLHLHRRARRASEARPPGKATAAWSSQE